MLFSNNFSALKEGDCNLYGKFCVWILLQGCPSPSLFAPSVVYYMIYGNLDKVESTFECMPQASTEICSFLTSLIAVIGREFPITI